MKRYICPQMTVLELDTESTIMDLGASGPQGLKQEVVESAEFTSKGGWDCAQWTEEE